MTQGPRISSAITLFFLVVALAGCGGPSSTSTGTNGNNPGSSNPAPNAGTPIVTFTANVTSVASGQSVSLQWVTSNVSSIAITQTVGSGSPTNVTTSTQATGTFQTAALMQTSTFTITATGASGATATAQVSVTVNQQPQITSFTATPATINAGQISNLAWATQNAVSVSITPSISNQTENGSLPLNTNEQPVTPSTTTNYVLTATGAAGTQPAQATVTVTITSMSVTLTATPASIAPGASDQLSWQTSGGVTGLTIADQSNNPLCGGSAAPCALPSGSAMTPTLSSTTTYIATATGAGGVTVTSTAVVTVSNATSSNTLKHIVFMLQENRSFDMYFGFLGSYRASTLASAGIAGAAASDVDDLHCTDAPCSNVTLNTRSSAPIPNAPVHPFHLTTACTENLSPSWDESHYDEHLTASGGDWSQTTSPSFNFTPSMFKMDRFLETTTSIQNTPEVDPNGTRPLGYYNNIDLPFYYDLASFFATSDRFFSPISANTIPNRMYIVAGTSFGHAYPDPPPTGGFSAPTLFGALTKAGISWRYYYLDNSVFLAHFADFNNPSVKGNVRNISEYYSILASPTADQDLPQVVFIERGGSTGLDEHPDTGTDVQKGAAVVQQIMTALMGSKAWQDSAFILSYDEAGGLYDHVAPISDPPPDNLAPGECPQADTSNGGSCTWSSSHAQAAFNMSGMRVPMIVISPWARPHWVSHVPRDSTSILAFIETTFAVPALTARDKYYQDPSRNLSEMFDFTQPALLNAPDGGPWVNPDGTPRAPFVHAQTTNLTCNASLGKAPGY